MSSLIIPEDVVAKIVQPPVGDLTLEDPRGRVIYAPQQDITTYELALIVRLFFRMTLGGPNGQTPDWRAFIAEHKLERHFELVGTIPTT